MKKSLLSLIVLLSLVSATVMAQTVSGRVTAATDGAPLPGVSILVKGTSTGTSTDADGKYSLNLTDKSAILVVSFIGFATQEVVAGDRTVIDVALSEDQTQLSEVVVTALGVSRETKTLVYATQAVKASEIQEVRDPNNVVNSLQGKVVGAQITQGSGGPGSGSRIVLRGNRSITGSNNALIVVDGVPIINTTYASNSSDFGGYQSADGVSNINPDDIESINVLRGASAAALYGSAAGNGVIIITTKKGTKDKVKVDVNSVVTSDNVFALPITPQNTYGQGNNGVLNTTASVGQSWGAKMTGQPYTDWNGKPATYSSQPNNIKDFFTTGNNISSNIAVSGGTDKTTTYLSYTNLKTNGIIPGNDLLRQTLNLRLTTQVGKRFSVDSKVTYTSQTIKGKQTNGEENNSPFDILQIPRSVSLAQAKDYETINNVGVNVPNPYPSSLASIYQNPYWVLNRYLQQENRERIQGFVLAKYKILNWLSIQGRANLDSYTDNLNSQAYDGTILWGKPNGNMTQTIVTNKQQWYDAMLEGENKVTSDLKINYRVGTIWAYSALNATAINAQGLNIPNTFNMAFATSPSVTPNYSGTKTQSAFAQANIAWKEAIFLDASVRQDYSSILPPPYSLAYPSIGVSGIISDLVTLPKVISFLKVSGNYAKVGNSGLFGVRNFNYPYSQGAGSGFLQRTNTEPITNLKPEIVTNLEFGIDMKFLENRLGFTATVYDSHSHNQLLQLSLPPSTGYAYKYINAGDIQNKGLEIVLNGTPVKGDLTWNVAFNLGMNRNKVIELDKQITQVLLAGGYSRSATPVVKVGGSYGDLLAFKWQRDDKGNFVVDGNGLPVYTKAQEYIGSWNPKAILGLTNSFDYKRFNLRLLIDGRAGGIIVSGTEMNLAYSGVPDVTSKNRETPWNLGGVSNNKDINGNYTGGTPVNHPITAQSFWQSTSGGRYGNAEFFAYDATNFRVRELSIGYNIPVPSTFLIKSVRISAVARNLFFLYRGSSILDIPGLGKRKMTFDPDMAISNNNFQGVSYGAFPSTRSIGFNLKLSF